MTQAIPVELIALSGEHHISELEDIDAVIRVYKPKVFRFVAFSVTDRDAAESITQDCFLKAHLTRDQFRGECSVSTWLMRIAINLVRDHTRSRRFQFWKKTQRVDNEEIHEWPDRNISPEEKAAVNERVQAVWEATNTLSERQRTVFLLRFVEDLDIGEIAQSTGLTENAVNVHLFRAVRGIRKRLGQGK